MPDETAPAPAVPPVQLVYLDVDDEITSAAARIRGSEAEGLALVLPYGSRLATSRINFRLLAREAAERGKKIEVVTADSSARALAAAAGLTVHPSVAAFEGHRSGVAADGGPGGVPGGETGGNGENDGNGTGPGDDATIAGPGAAKVPVGALSIEDDTQTRVITLPRRRSPRVPLVGPARAPVRPGVAIGVGVAAIVLVLVAGILALELLPSATIVLAPRSEEVGPVTLSVEARPDVAVPDPVALVIPAQRVAFTLEATQTVTATGVKVTETKATGNVTFSNFDTGRGVLIPAGTIVKTESEIEFQTLAEVTLPRATYEFRTDPPGPRFELVPSTSSVGVEAVLPGKGGNVGNNSITVIPKAKRTLTVTNPEATSGGAHTEAPEITRDDVDTALLALDDALAEDLGRQIEERTGVPPGATLFAQTQLVGPYEYATDPTSLVGSSEEEVQLDATAEGTVLGVDPSPIQAIAEARLQSHVAEGWSLAAGSTTFELGIPSILGEAVTYPVSIAGTQVHDVNQAALVTEIRGRPLTEARSRLDDFGDVEVTLWPDWVTTIPKNADRITLTLAEPQPAPEATP
jgi:hypothetical protein